MKPDATSVSLNDWVYSDSPGIWRIYRIVQDVQKLKFALQERARIDKRRLIFSKRFVDESWKPAFSTEVVSADSVRALSDEDRRRLDEFIANHPEALREFEAFEPEASDHAMDLPLNVPTTVAKEDVQGLIRDVFSGIQDDGLTNNAILQRLSASELARYAPKTIRNAILRFICKGHELRNNEYVFREVQLLMV